MAAAEWPLQNDRPEIRVVISRLSGGHELVRRLVADTGAGTRRSAFELVLLEGECLKCGGIPMGHVRMGGAYSGSFLVYLVAIRIPELHFDEPVPVVGVLATPPGFDGIAGFRFLNRFHYGNFGTTDGFRLESLILP